MKHVKFVDFFTAFFVDFSNIFYFCRFHGIGNDIGELVTVTRGLY